MATHALPRNPRDLARTVYRHKGKAATFCLAVFAVTAAAVVFMPRSFRSEAKLLVRLGRENATLDPTVTLGQKSTVAVPPSRDNEINSVVEVLNGRAVVERVVDEVGPQAILDLDDEAGDTASADDGVQQAALVPWQDRVESTVDAVKQSWRQIADTDALTDRDRAIAQVQQELDVERLHRSNIIFVRYEAGSPEVSQQVVSAALGAFLDEHRRINRPRGADQFFVEQTDRLHQQLTDAEAKLEQLKDEAKLVTVQSRQRTVSERVGRLEDELLQAASTEAATRARVERLRQLLADMPQQQVASTTEGVGNDGTDRMREDYFALQIAEQQARSRFTDNHPEVLRLQRQLEVVKDILDKQDETRTHVTTTPDEAFEALRIELAQEEPTLASLVAATATVREQLVAARAEQESLNAYTTRLAQLEREIQVKDEQYRQYATNREQTHIDAALNELELSNVGIVQGATLDRKPTKPQPALLVLLGLVVGVFGGVGIAVVAEYGDQSLQTAEDIESHLQLPALTTIPRLRRRQLAVNGNH